MLVEVNECSFVLKRRISASLFLSVIFTVLVEVSRELLLVPSAIGIISLRHPLIHGALNELAHVVAHHITIGLRVVDSLAIQCIPKEGIQIVIQGYGHKLYVAALDRHHERRDACLRHRIDINGI